MLAEVAQVLDDGPTRRGILEAGTLLDASVAEARLPAGQRRPLHRARLRPAGRLGRRQTLNDYPAAVTTCIRAGGDVDTTAAMTGGIVATYTGLATTAGDVTGVPRQWLAAREHLPDRANRRTARA